MTLAEDLKFIQDSVDVYRTVAIDVNHLWGWSIVMQEDGFPSWKRTTKRIEDVVTLVVEEITQRDG